MEVKQVNIFSRFFRFRPLPLVNITYTIAKWSAISFRGSLFRTSYTESWIMNFVKDKIRMVLFGLIIASVMLVHHVKAAPTADSKQNGKEYPASRFNGNKSQCPEIDSTIIDTELERGNWYICRVIALIELVQLAFLTDSRKWNTCTLL